MHEAKYTLCQTSCSGVKRALHTQVLNVADISLVSSRVAGRLASLYNTEIQSDSIHVNKHSDNQQSNTYWDCRGIINSVYS